MSVKVEVWAKELEGFKCLHCEGENFTVYLRHWDSGKESKIVCKTCYRTTELPSGTRGETNILLAFRNLQHERDKFLKIKQQREQHISVKEKEDGTENQI